MKWRWPWRRDDAPPAAGAPGSGETLPGAARLQWLGWDGRTLRWRLIRDPSNSSELCIDGVVFQRFEARVDERAFECAFEFSPTGHDELEFSVAAGHQHAPLAPSWRVRLGVPATPGADQWTAAPRWLAPLAGTPRLPAIGANALPEVAVVVPVYNAAASVQRCLDALDRWTPPSARWILVDDASTDAAIAPLLARHVGRPGVQIERHPRNRGYTSAVNTGIAAAGRADVVLLNSDTEVGPRWLDSLRLAAYGDDAIGTVTAVSDNAGAFSVPELEQYCPMPARWDIVQTQRAVLQQAGLRFPELPTGNGFCLFIKRAVIDRVGVMDADAFPAGYGEENDFCQRALAVGWRHVVAGHVLVRHERSASFGDARRVALGVQGMSVLRARWPRYEADVGATLRSFERCVLDYRVRRTYVDSDGRYAIAPPRPRVLLAGFADPDSAFAGAGSEEVFVLHASARLELHDVAAGRVLLAADGNDSPAAARERQIREWLLSAAIERVALDRSGDAAFAAKVADCAASLGIPVSTTT